MLNHAKINHAKTAPITVKLCEDPNTWNAFVNTVPWTTPQHTYGWGESLASIYSYVQLVYRLFYFDDRPVAGLPLMRFSAGGPFRALYSSVFDSYGGPLVHPDFVDHRELLSTISSEIDAEAAIHKAFEYRVLVPPMAPESMLQCMQRDDQNLTTKRLCPVLDLDHPLERIQAGYKSSFRRAIRRSIREGISIQADADIELVRKAYGIYEETMRRLGGTAKPWRFIEKLLCEKLAIPFVAQKGGRPVGLVILLVSKNLAIYWISSANPAASSSRPTNALVDAAIRWCHQRAIGRFSFGETPGERPSLVKFKQGWNPESTYSTTVTRTYRPWVRRGWHVLQPTARNVYSIWDRSRHRNN